MVFPKKDGEGRWLGDQGTGLIEENQEQSPGNLLLDSEEERLCSCNTLLLVSALQPGHILPRQPVKPEIQKKDRICG